MEQDIQALRDALHQLESGHINNVGDKQLLEIIANCIELYEARQDEK